MEDISGHMSGHIAEHVAQYPETELGRLIRQARRLRPFTERMLRTIGVRRGMRVLDVGCGIGDASMLAADLVGPGGAVIGIDADGTAVELAGRRVADAGLHQAEIAALDLVDFADPEPFDVVLSRHVLIYREDPVDFLRRAARFVKPGGVVAIHEVDAYRALDWLPHGSLVNQLTDVMVSAFPAGVPNGDVGSRMIAAFLGAGLPCPNVLSEMAPPERDEAAQFPRASEVLRNVLPQLIRDGVVSEEDMIDIDGIEDRMRAESQDAWCGATTWVPRVPQYCAWARLPRAAAGRRIDPAY
jgi:2-polyprenyl-3-methyl-5-hydroxy-6-metoxy-1,4-benzoquinol methylase